MTPLHGYEVRRWDQLEETQRPTVNKMMATIIAPRFEPGHEALVLMQSGVPLAVFHFNKSDVYRMISHPDHRADVYTDLERGPGAILFQHLVHYLSEKGKEHFVITAQLPEGEALVKRMAEKYGVRKRGNAHDVAQWKRAIGELSGDVRATWKED